MSVELHRGDCIEILPTLAEGSIDLVLCDLPYGVTACAWDQIIPLEPLWAHYRRLLKPRGAVVLTASQPFTSMLVMSNPKWFRYEWVWVRGRKASGHLDAKRRPLRRHESVLVFSHAQATYNPIMVPGPSRKATAGDQRTASSPVFRPGLSRHPWSSASRYPNDVLEIDAVDSRRRIHPTQKPVALMEYLIRTYSNPGDTVLDNAMGTGTTGVACLRTERRFIGIEKDPDIFRTAEARIAAERGRTPLFSEAPA